MTEPVVQGEKRLVALQLLRGVAATMVVLLHAQDVISDHAEARGQSLVRLIPLPLGAGVDLFFVISGFVIVYASSSLFAERRGCWEFLRRRLIRIIPLYWMVLTLRLLVLALASFAGAKTFPDQTAILTSYLFIPYDALGFGKDYPFPILDLGWSLNYEMFFYVIFAAFIFLRRELAIAATVTFLLCGVVLAAIWQPDSTALRFWFQPITLEFAAGTLIALLVVRGVMLSSAARIGLVIAALALWQIPLSTLGDVSGPGTYSWSRLTIWGGGAILAVAAAVLGPMRLTSSWSKIAPSIGDSSYALYLLHPFAFLFVKAALTFVSVPPALHWPGIIATTAFAVIVAIVFHKYVELPVTNYLKKRTAIGFPVAKRAAG